MNLLLNHLLGIYCCLGFWALEKAFTIKHRRGFIPMSKTSFFHSFHLLFLFSSFFSLLSSLFFLLSSFLSQPSYVIPRCRYEFYHWCPRKKCLDSKSLGPLYLAHLMVTNGTNVMLICKNVLGEVSNILFSPQVINATLY
jgi:hypothetical protein